MPHVIARSSWFDFDAALINKFCSRSGFPLSSSSGLLDILVEATVPVLDILEEQALDLCFNRIARVTTNRSQSKQLLQVCGAAEVMAKEEEPAVAGLHPVGRVADVGRPLCGPAFACRRPKASSLARGPSGGGRCKKYPAALPSDLSAIRHSGIKQIVPEDGRVWTSNHAQACTGHAPPNSTSRAWRRYEALRLTLVAVWQQHCDTHTACCTVLARCMDAVIGATAAASAGSAAGFSAQ